MEILVLGLIKIIDNVITTAKNITTYQNKKLTTSLLVAISQFLFYSVIQSVVENDSALTTWTVCACSGIGTYIAMHINDKFKRDITYTNILKCECHDSIKELCEYLRDANIDYDPFEGRDIDGTHKITIMVHAKTKYESRLIDKFLENSTTKYTRRILK